MAEDQYQSEDANGEPDYDAAETTTTPVSVVEVVTNPLDEDYVEEELPDVTVKLIINDAPDYVLDAAVTDMYGNIIPQTATPLIDQINDYTASISQGIYDGINDATGKKHWWGELPRYFIMDTDLDTVFVNLRIDDDLTQSKAGTLLAQGSWTSRKVLYVVLIALCIIAIILAILFLVLGKKFKKNKRSAPAGTSTVTKSVVTKGISPDPKYQPVRNV